MVKILQIAFMWLAAILLLAHQFVPHHHHDQGVETCESTSQNEHEHKQALNFEMVYDVNDCLCDHQHSKQHTDCDLEFKTIEKSQHVVYLLAVLALLFTIEVADDNADYQVTNDILIKQQFNQNLFLRGPPSKA